MADEKKTVNEEPTADGEHQRRPIYDVGFPTDALPPDVGPQGGDPLEKANSHKHRMPFDVGFPTDTRPPI